MGTDNQGRDIFSTILYGARISLFVGFAAVVFSMVLGIGLGLLAGWRGGWVDSLLMRIADVQLSFPSILIALLIFGVARGFISGETTHAGSACLRVPRDDNGRSWPLNAQHHLDKWGVGVRAPGGYDAPATPPIPSLSHLRARAWRPDR
jgi:ABC-type dipeptide/oligopeptide/nickel transport system permease component